MPPPAARPRTDEAEDDVDDREHRQEVDPRPPVDTNRAEGVLEGPGGGDQHGGEDRQEQERQERVAHPQPGGEGAVEAAGGGQADGGDDARGGEQERRRRGRCRRATTTPTRSTSLEQRASWTATAEPLAEEDAGRVEAREAQGVAGRRRRPRRRRPAASRAAAENSTATQNRPGVARSSTPRSASRAKPNSSRTSRANGATWFVVTRLRSSTRRSLPATSARVSEARAASPEVCDRRSHGATGDGHGRSAPRAVGPVELVAGDDDGGAGGGGVGDAGRRRRRGRPGRARRGARRAATAPGGGRRGRRATRAGAGRPRAGRRARSASRPSRPRRAMAASTSAALGAGGPRPEADVVGDGEVVVEAGGVAEEPDPAAHGAALAGVGAGRGRAPAPRPTTTGRSAGAGPQQRRLAGAVRPSQEHDLAPLDVEVDAGEGGEAAERARPRRGGGRRAPWDRGQGYVRGPVLAGQVGTSRTLTSWRPRGRDEERSAASSCARVLGGVGRTMITAGVAASSCSSPTSCGARASAPPRPRTGSTTSSPSSWRRPTRPTAAAAATTHHADDGRRPAGQHHHDDRLPATHRRHAAGGAAAPARRRRRPDRDPAHRRRLDLRRGRVGRQPQGRPRPLPRRRRCPARPATPPSPGTARPTARRSATSTSSQPGDEIIVTTVQGDFTYLVQATEIVSPVARSRCSRPTTGTSTAIRRRSTTRSRSRRATRSTRPGSASSSPPSSSGEPGARPRRRADRRGSGRGRDRRLRGRRGDLSGDAGRGLAGDLLGRGLRRRSGWRRGRSAGGAEACKWPAYLVGLVPFTGRPVLLLRELLPPPAGELLSALSPGAVVLAVAVVGLAACSGGDDDSSDAASPDGTTTTAPVERSTAEEAPLAVGQCGDVPRSARRRRPRPGDGSDRRLRAAPRRRGGRRVRLPARAPARDFPGDRGRRRLRDRRSASSASRPTSASPTSARPSTSLIVAPDEDGWDDGDRRIACVLYHIDFADLVGSVAGTAR